MTLNKNSRQVVTTPGGKTAWSIDEMYRAPEICRTRPEELHIYFPPAPEAAAGTVHAVQAAPQPESWVDPPAADREARLMPWADRLEDCEITYYDVCLACCGKKDGITASGVPAVPYETCAVDPEVIPLGSAVTVDYGGGVLRHLRAMDTGVRGNHVDICVAGHEEAVSLGRETATVYWIGGEAAES